jgi:hypothetical protein
MALDIFEHRFGDARMPYLDDDKRPQIALDMLNAVQTVVDVIADEANHGYAVSFAPTPSAFTEHQKRQIVISGMPLFAATIGTPLRDVAAILTGFAVHEVGHTRRIGIIDAVRAEWPGKKLPKVLANVIEDVVLEERTIQRYAGFRDVFTPTLEWVAEQTCPKHTLVWEGSTGHKVNLVGQIVRYEPFVTFADDAVTKGELRWWKEWAARITADLTPKGGVEMVREALARLAAQREQGETEEQPEPPKPPKGEGEPIGDSGQNLPDEEDEPDDDGGDTEGEGNGEAEGDGDDTEGDGDGSDGDESDEDGGTEGGGDSDEDGDDETEGPDGGGNPGPKGGSEAERETEPVDGDEAGQGEGDGEGSTGDPSKDRVELDKGAQDSDGAGGSGQGIAEAGDEDPDAGFDETELDKSFDDLSVTDSAYRDQVLQAAVEDERVTTRMDAGIHGQMKVVWR